MLLGLGVVVAEQVQDAVHREEVDLLLAGVAGLTALARLLGLLVRDPRAEHQVAEQQAPAAGHERDDEMALLTVHGILHLLGYDHAEPEEHAEMFGIQGRLLLEWADPALREQ